MPDIEIAEQRRALESWFRRNRPDDEPRFAETHVSILAFGSDRVWKLKKAVEYPFVDLSTRELRRGQCEREVALNRRLAPDVYVGVVPLDDGRGQVVDHLVEMRRMPDAHRLASVAASGADALGCLDRLADLLASFHARAASGPAIDASATRDAVGALWDENIAEMHPRAGALLPVADLDRVALLARRYLAGRAPVFDDRVSAGRARDGHGDLLADDVFCLPDGPRALDCLEFADRLRWGDTLADVAFLAMDLERLGRADLARAFLDRYARAAGDTWPESLEHLYIAYRALVRSKIACMQAIDGVEESAALAHRLLSLTRTHLEAGRIRLVLIGGPPATGKTTLANAVGRALGWPVLHSDEVRKELAGLAPTTHVPSALDTGLYGSSWDARTYAALCTRARHDLERGRSVVIDASWGDPEQRARASRVAIETSSELVAFRCGAPREVVEARATNRMSKGTDASDATAMLAEALAARFAPWPEAQDLATTAAPDVAAASLIRRLDT